MYTICLIKFNWLDQTAGLFTSYMVTEIPLLGIYPKKTIIQKDMHPSVHCSTIYNIIRVRTWTQPKCLSTYERIKMWCVCVCVCVYNGILLSHKKEWIWVSSSKLDEPRACYTEWSQKEKNKYCILTYMESIKIELMKLVQNGLVDTAVEGEGRMNWESRIYIYIHIYIYTYTHTTMRSQW